MGKYKKFVEGLDEVGVGKLKERLQKKIEIEGGCWAWRGATTNHQPVIGVGKDQMYVRKLLYYLEYGVEGTMRGCVTGPSCVNPEHVKVVGAWAGENVAPAKRLELITADIVVMSCRYEAMMARAVRLDGRVKELITTQEGLIRLLAERAEV